MLHNLDKTGARRDAVELQSILCKEIEKKSNTRDMLHKLCQKCVDVTPVCEVVAKIASSIFSSLGS